MLSESQERMVLVAQRGKEEVLHRVFDRWGLEVETVGEVTATGRAVIRDQGKVVADLPIRPLTDGAPVYRRPVAEPADLEARHAAPKVPDPGDVGKTLQKMLDTPELGSKAWIWRQYDHSVRTNTVRGPGGDAAVVALKGTPLGIAMTCDVNPVYCALDPRSGGMQAVAESVRNLACVGAEPLGVSDCLNFGNPENPEVSWQFRESVRGISQACRELEVPVISGNVSFYNETDGVSIHPTPAISMAGVLPDLTTVPRTGFINPKDRVILLGEDQGEHGGSAYLRLLHGIEQGRPPLVDLAAEARLSRLLRFLAFEGLLVSAHDISTGGLAVALAEASFETGLGAKLELPVDPVGFFSESQGRVVLSVAPAKAERVLEEAEMAGVPALDVGAVGGDHLALTLDGAKAKVAVSKLHEVWRTALPRALDT